MTKILKTMSGGFEVARIDIKIENCNGNEYVLFSACAYNGNKFNMLKRN